MNIGFAKNDITPRLGVELCGFGPFIGRHAIGIRDRLWARAMALEQDGRRALVISCDLIGVSADTTRRVRTRLRAAAGVAEDDLMICASHTHSGPGTLPDLIGWGALDQPYVETLPQRIAQAGLAAVRNLQAAVLAHAAVPCEGIGLNREYDQDAPPLENVLREDWRPAKPELTDTRCQVLAARAPDGRLLGFASYFGCHPVVCCAASRHLHGDYCGVATNLIERESGGTVGLFLQGAHGDVNTCVVHKPEQESLLALDVIAGRYARAVRRGLAAASPLNVDWIGGVRRAVAFTRKPWGVDQLQALLAKTEARLNHPDATDAYATDDWNVRMETVYLLALRALLARAARGDPLSPAMEIQGLRLGPVTLLGSPFETFQAIKNEVQAQARAPLPLVMSVVNDESGYAPDKITAARGGYAADMVPMICGQLPFANIHEELKTALLRVDAALNGPR